MLEKFVRNVFPIPRIPEKNIVHLFRDRNAVANLFSGGVQPVFFRHNLRPYSIWTSEAA